MFNWIREWYLNFKADQILLPKGQYSFYSDFIIAGSDNIKSSIEYVESEQERKYQQGVLKLKREVSKKAATDEEIREYLKSLTGDKDMLSLVTEDGSFVEFIRNSLTSKIEDIKNKRITKKYVEQRIEDLHYRIDMKEIRDLNRLLRKAIKDNDESKIKELTEVINGKRKTVRQTSRSRGF